MDPLATYTVTEAARERAVGADGQERGPVFIEAVQYRFGAHTTADDPDVYRDDAEVEQWRERDPLDRMEQFLRNCNLLDDEKIDVMDDTIDEQLGEIIDNAELTPLNRRISLPTCTPSPRRTSTSSRSTSRRSANATATTPCWSQSSRPSLLLPSRRFRLL